ncbi:MAG: LytTR family DNA-binding domain-containing protein [Kangiellaceae bacterium]|nr:LytTR family DNA-binding domain-containing protein [Kangiellaceae bacterium]MCW8998219.1 LytTR family DNA-binding domain-containing protein [Kangiellaceae bacterium]MCW9015449.1 LytTR family DNA-binding domain-containing protein [Kangiellaceae bacterium]
MNIVIVEDEPVIAQRLKRQINNIAELKPAKINHFDSFDDAQEYLAENTIDLLFLDLNLHGTSGFDLLKSVTAASFHTIIVSAYAEQAIKAFEYGVVDFVAKPFNQERINQAVTKVLDAKARSDYGARHLAVRKTAGIALVEVKDIVYVKADGHYTHLILADKKSHLHDKPIEKIAKLLPLNFERVHRSYLVNMNMVKALRIEAGGSYQLELKTELSLDSIPLSRSRFTSIKNKLEG